MLQVESASQRPIGFADEVALPLGRAGGDGASFSSLYRSLHADIRDTIENGFGSSAPSTLATGVLPSQLNEGSQTWLSAYLAGGPTAPSGKAGASSPVDEEARLAFLRDIAPWAQAAGAQLGASPHIIAAHAALESNWGRQPVMSEGRSAFNLFGIKAGESWKGRAVSQMTTEHIDGETVRMPQRFRAYAGYDSAFRDYARLLKDNPRYAEALNAGDDARAFGRGLQKGGYATDRAYEEKLVSVARQIERLARRGG